MTSAQTVRKFKLSCTSKQYTLLPSNSSTTLRMFPPHQSLMALDHFCHFSWIFRETLAAQHAEIAQCLQTGIATDKHSERSASRCTTHPHAPLSSPFLQRRITSPHSVPATSVDIRPTRSTHASYTCAQRNATHCQRARARSRCRALHFAHRDPRHPTQTACIIGFPLQDTFAISLQGKAQTAAFSFQNSRRFLPTNQLAASDALPIHG